MRRMPYVPLWNLNRKKVEVFVTGPAMLIKHRMNTLPTLGHQCQIRWRQTFILLKNSLKHICSKKPITFSDYSNYFYLSFNCNATFSVINFYKYAYFYILQLLVYSSIISIIENVKLGYVISLFCLFHGPRICE